MFSSTHSILRYGLMLANDGELDGKRYLSPAAMEELRKEQTGTTEVNYSLGYPRAIKLRVPIGSNMIESGHRHVLPSRLPA